MISADQLDTLKDMFAQCDDDWLLSHISIKHSEHRSFVIHVEKANWQYCGELFPEQFPPTPEQS